MEGLHITATKASVQVSGGALKGHERQSGGQSAPHRMTALSSFATHSLGRVGRCSGQMGLEFSSFKMALDLPVGI